MSAPIEATPRLSPESSEPRALRFDESELDHGWADADIDLASERPELGPDADDGGSRKWMLVGLGASGLLVALVVAGMVAEPKPSASVEPELEALASAPAPTEPVDEPPAVIADFASVRVDAQPTPTLAATAMAAASTPVPKRAPPPPAKIAPEPTKPAPAKPKSATAKPEPAAAEPKPAAAEPEPVAAEVPAAVEPTPAEPDSAIEPPLPGQPKQSAEPAPAQPSPAPSGSSLGDLPDVEGWDASDDDALGDPIAPES